MPTETSLHFDAAHPAFAGHFPGHPMVPGALLLDTAVHAIASTLAGAPDTAGTGAKHALHIVSAKFLSPVQPGETLTLSWTPAASGAIRFAINCGTRQIARGTLQAEAAHD